MIDAASFARAELNSHKQKEKKKNLKQRGKIGLVDSWGGRRESERRRGPAVQLETSARQAEFIGVSVACACHASGESSM